MHGLKLQIQLHIGAFLNANERCPEILRRSYMFFKSPHAARAAPEVLDRKGQGRTLIMVQDQCTENS